MAAIQGLRLVHDRMFVGDWSRDPVHVVSDNLFVVNQTIGEWEAGALGWHHELLSAAADDVSQLIEGPVYFSHAANEENAGAHTLVKSFPAACDRRNRDGWVLERLRERWGELAGKLDAELGEAVRAGSPTSFDGKTLKVWFPPRQGRARLRVSRNLEAVGRVISDGCGSRVRVVIA